MRTTTLFAGLAGAFLVTSSLRAVEAPPDVRTVIVPQAQVWCGPSNAAGLYPTNVLRQGEHVQVLEELPDGWLSIRPPVGSFSWINNRFVQPVAPRYANYVVTEQGHPVPVLVGSSLKTDRPNKIGVSLPRGAQVRVIGRAMKDEGGTWLPIEPPPSEVRFIRKESVTKAPHTTASAKPVLPDRAPDADTLWRDAEKAENAGRLSDAVRLYLLAGAANASVNPQRADEAYRRAHWIQQASLGQRPAVAAVPAAASSPYVLPSNTGSANVFQPIGSAPAATNAQLVSTQGAAPAAHYQGRLQTAFRNGRYHLMDNRGSPIVSVAAGPGVDLTSHTDHNVELWGNLTYEQELRHYLLTVTQVRELP